MEYCPVQVMKMDEILSDVLEEIKPTEEDRKRLEDTSDRLLKRIRKEVSDLGYTAEPMIVGSSARGTWIKDEKDIDIFLLFPEDLPREELEERGLEIGRNVSEDKGTEQYAEHPYIRAKIDDFDIDVVPCYDIDDPSDIQSAVDRSPHHQDYVKENLNPEMAEQVLLLKKFLKGIDAYGSELEVHGFSGYLCELLILRFGSFRELVESAADWDTEKVLSFGDDRDEEDLLEAFPAHPLVFIDPVDPSRNVAAAVSRRNYARFVRACQDFLRDPTEKFFFPEPPTPTKEEMRGTMDSRGTKIFMVHLRAPSELVPDIVYPQLRKTRRAIIREIEDSDFEVLRSGVWFEEGEAAIILEFKFHELPEVREHVGPPLGVDPRPFVEKYLDSRERIAGPFVNGDGRLIFELKRELTQAGEALQEALESPEGFGSHLEESIEEGDYEIWEGEEMVDKAEEVGALDFLGEYLTKCLPWYR